jgi:high-affinity Fe2+/Pb2+ permease
VVLAAVPAAVARLVEPKQQALHRVIMGGQLHLVRMVVLVVVVREVLEAILPTPAGQMAALEQHHR